MGDQSYESSRTLGVALAKLTASEKPSGETLVLASSDLSHYHTYDRAEIMDHNTLHALSSWDYFSMSRNFESRVWEACGGAPIVAAMIYAEHRGANKAEVLRYGNSGETSGDRTHVVGYSADLFVKTANAAEKDAPFSLSSEEKAELLALARHATEYAVTNHEMYEPPSTTDATLNEEHGAFVTLTESGELRGCVGYTSPVKPLYLTVRDTATLAALRDGRFRPVEPAELPLLEYEISVLSPLRHVSDMEQIEIGRDGLLVKSNGHEGLLLPQVAVDQKWDRQTFLEQTCVKAGQPTDCWKNENTDVFRFTSVVFTGERPASQR
jgi:AmmeMemoRadiSam system protein A